MAKDCRRQGCLSLEIVTGVKGAVGVPTVCTTIRLADWPEGNYLNSDLEKPEIGMRRGEVLIGWAMQAECSESLAH